MSSPASLEVQYNLIRNFARQTPVNATVTSFSVIFSTLMLWPYVPTSALVAWATLHLALVSLLFVRWMQRYLQARRGKVLVSAPRAPLEMRVARGSRRAILFAIISGVLWGATVFTLPYLPPVQTVAMVIVVSAMTGGATTTLSAIPMAAAAYALTTPIPFSVYFFLRGFDSAFFFLGLQALVMTAGMLWASRSVHGTFIEDVKARIEATEALEELRRSRDEWLDVAQSTDAFALFDADKQLKFWNAEFERLITTGSVSVRAGLSWEELLAGFEPSESESSGLITAQERHDRYVRHLPHADDPFIERLADGRWIRSVMRPTERGNLVWLVQDITAERQREAVEMKLRARLSESKQLQTIGQFASGVAHDFNNVLGAIQSFAEFMTMPASKPDGRLLAAQRIVKACERGAGMVRNILQLATASRIEKATFKFASAFDQAVNILPRERPENVTFTIDNRAESSFVDANESQVIQLLLNLIVNAFAALKGRVGRISLYADQINVDTATVSRFFNAAANLDGVTTALDGSSQFVFGMLLPEQPYVKIVIEDNGVGIEPDLLSRIFDPFVTTKESTLRTGFGLTVVRSVVLASDGALLVRSTVGKGTTFEVYLPVIAAPSANQAAPAPNQPHEGNERVMVVDDDPDSADGLVLALRGMGYDAVAIYEPGGALAEYVSSPQAWDAVVADQAMPGMGGHELAARIKQVRADARIFLYTGHASDELRQRAAGIGVAGVLQKPVDPKILAGLIRG